MKNDKREALFNTLTYVALGATACLLVYYMLVGFFNIFNPFPPPTLIAVAPTSTSTPVGPTSPPTWTPTNTPTITPTPGPTDTPTVTPTPSTTPTWPPTRTPTPRFTRSPWPFTVQMDTTSPQYGCNWTGIGGHVQDLEGNPLVGYPVHIWGAGVDVVVSSGANTQHNTIYNNEAAWEQFFDSSPKPMRVEVQLHDPYQEEHPPISEKVVVDLPGYCGAALGYVVFTQNH